MDMIKKLSIIGLVIVGLSLVVSSTAMAQDPYDYYGDYTADAGGLALLGGIMCIIPIIFFVIGILIAIWVYRDAEKRGSSGVLWLIICLLTGIIGLIIWFVVRPPIGGKPASAESGGAGRMCPSCGRPIPMDARVCPYCGKNFEQ